MYKLLLLTRSSAELRWLRARAVLLFSVRLDPATRLTAAAEVIEVAETTEATLDDDDDAEEPPRPRLSDEVEDRFCRVAAVSA